MADAAQQPTAPAEPSNGVAPAATKAAEPPVGAVVVEAHLVETHRKLPLLCPTPPSLP